VHFIYDLLTIITPYVTIAYGILVVAFVASSLLAD
jgi:hypothetical protein